MFSEQDLSANLAALARAQGRVPALGALDPATTRAIPDERYGLALEIRNVHGEWKPLDGPLPEESAAFALPDVEPAHIVAAGLGLGYVLDAMERRAWRTRVIAVEPDPGVATLFLSRRDWTSWFDSGRLRLVVGPEFQGATACARAIDAAVVPVVIVQSTMAAHRPVASAAAVAIAERMLTGARANAEARRRFAGKYLLQTLANVPAIARAADVRALGDVCVGLPAIVVAAGPSLDDNLAAIRTHRHRAVVIAADTALRPLAAANLPPDLVVAVDPSDLNARHLTGVSGAEDVCLVAEGSVHASAFDAFRSRTFVFRVSDHEPWPWLDRFGLERGVLRAWGSVAISAFDLAQRLGCDPIVFAGQDLAYTGRRPYCTNTLYDELWRAAMREYGCTWAQLVDDYFARQALMAAVDVHGLPTETTPTLVAFRDALVDQAAASRRTIVNATGAGIFHGPGVRQGSIDAILARWPAVASVRARIRSALAAGAGRAATLRDEPGLVDRWRAFAADTIDASVIRSALDTLLSDQMVPHESA